MNTDHITKISHELDLNPRQVQATAQLLEQDATVPFISRYRKEATGSLDEVEITSIRDRLDQLVELDKRREAILASLIERDLLTDDLNGKFSRPKQWPGSRTFTFHFDPSAARARQSLGRRASKHWRR